MDIVVLGGGLTALSTAWELLNRQQNVSIHYTSRTGSASQNAGGMLSPCCEADGCVPELIQLAVRSCKKYPEWIRNIESTSNSPCGYTTSGTLLVALHHDHHQELNHLRSFQDEVGLHAEWLSRKELRNVSPNLTRHVGGLKCSDDHHVNPKLLWESIRCALVQRGVQFVEGNPEFIIEDGSVVGVRNNGQNYSGDQFVLADGAWSDSQIQIPIRPVKGQYLILAPKVPSPPLISCVIRTPDVYLIPRENGRIYVGATMEEEDFDARQTAGATLDFLYHAFQVLPGVYEMVVEHSGCGFRPALRDNQPLIGPGPLKNLWLNIGHYRHGVMLAPAAANLLSQALLENVSIPDDFGWTRFTSIRG